MHKYPSYSGFGQRRYLPAALRLRRIHAGDWRNGAANVGIVHARQSLVVQYERLSVDAANRFVQEQRLSNCRDVVDSQ